MSDTGAELAGNERRQRRLNQPQRVSITARAPGCASGYRWYRLSYWLPGGTGAELGQVRHGYRISMGFGNGLQRFLQRLAAEAVVFTFRRGVVALHDKRRRVIQDETLYTAGDALQRVLRQRLFAIKDRRRTNRPVDTLCGGPPWRQSAHLDSWRLRIRVGCLRPGDRLPIPAHHHEKAFPDGRSAIVACTQLAILDDIAQAFYQTCSFLAVQRNIQKFAAFRQRRMIR